MHWQDSERSWDLISKDISNHRLDLHIHTSYSDGTQDIEELCLLSLKSNIQIISFTDHNTVMAYKEKKVINKYGLAYIPGIELSAIHNGTQIHLLGYGIDTNAPLLNQICDEYRKREFSRDIKMLQHLLPSEEFSFHNYGAYTYSPHRGGWKLLNYMQDKGLCKNTVEYFSLLSKVKDSFIEYKSVNEVSQIIHTAGGVCILAHPGTFLFSEEECQQFLWDIIKLGIDGIECFHPLNGSIIVNTCLHFCKSNNLLVTGGSDHHGNLPDRELGVPTIMGKDLVLGSLINKIYYN